MWKLYAMPPWADNKKPKKLGDIQVALTRVSQTLRAVIQEQKVLLNTKNASSSIGVPLSSYHSFLGGLPFSSTLSSETYHRSQLADISRAEVKAGSLMYADPKFKKILQNGGLAHAGAYGNSFFRKGDNFKIKSTYTPPTSAGDGLLFNKLLAFELESCKRVASYLVNAKNLKVGVYNDYPCLMVYINQLSHTENLSKAGYSDWVNFLISIYTGFVNYKAYASGIPIEMIRRSSFGFLSPTVSPTGYSIRINPGIIPLAYEDVLVSSLQQLDNTLTDLFDKKTNLPLISETLFYGNEIHRNYLSKKYDTPKLDNELQLLFQQVESNGKTTIQNIMRTSFARDGIAANVFNTLADDKPVNEAFLKGLNWAVSRISVHKKGKGYQLSFDSSGEVKYKHTVKKASIRVDDEAFWQMIIYLKDRVKKSVGLRVAVKPYVAEFENLIKIGKVDYLYAYLEAINEMMLVSEMRQKKTEVAEDGYGSDSDTEEAIDKETTVYSKKLIVSNGMRAIWASLITIGLKTNRKFSVLLDSAYYEVELGCKLMKELEQMSIEIAKTNGNAAMVCIHDINACITDGVAKENKITKFIDETQNKILILDTTSATTSQVRAYIERFAASRASTLFLVSSGLKHEQLGADKNSYGTIRMATKNKNRLNELYSSIKLHELPVLSPLSHKMRRMMKKIGAVPTSATYFKK